MKNVLKMMSKTRLVLSVCGFLLSSIVLFSCDGKNDAESMPSNLELSITIQGADEANPNGDGTGRVTCVAKANNGVRYAYRFNGGDLQESSDGIIEHTFSNKGINTYSILVFAFSSSEEFINITKSVKVIVGDNMTTENTTGENLVFADEFNSDGAPNQENWTYDLGRGSNGWGNNELQTYTNSSENVIIEGGFLKITAKADGSGGYTSTRLKSQNLQEFKYGRVEVRAKLPAAQGTWPAIWMLGANFESVGWPSCGEIDIMEQTGWDKSRTSGALHFPDNSGGNAPNDDIENQTSTTEFHNYIVEWNATEIKLSVDNESFFSFQNNVNTPFNNEFFFIFNIAMGGTLGGSVEDSFTEDTMEVDYIRVYQ